MVAPPLRVSLPVSYSLFNVSIGLINLVSPSPSSSSTHTPHLLGALKTTEQFVRVCMDNQPANVRLFVMHGGVETFVDLIGNAFQHAHSLSASSSPVPGGSSSTAAPSASVATRSSVAGSEEEFGGSATSPAAAGPGSIVPSPRTPRRERASDMSVALTCRELVVECISCLSSALEV